MAVKTTEKELEEFCITIPIDAILEVLLRKHFLNAPNFDLFKCIYKGQGYDIEIRKFEKKSSLDMLNELEEENQALKDRWEAFKKWIADTKALRGKATYFLQETLLEKMQELEKEIK